VVYVMAPTWPASWIARCTACSPHVPASLKPVTKGGVLTDYFIRQPSDPYAGYALKWDGEWQVTYETFRDMGLPTASG
jgi:hypothetical protein